MLVSCRAACRAFVSCVGRGLCCFRGLEQLGASQWQRVCAWRQPGVPIAVPTLDAPGCREAACLEGGPEA